MAEDVIVLLAIKIIFQHQVSAKFTALKEDQCCKDYETGVVVLNGIYNVCVL